LSVSIEESEEKLDDFRLASGGGLLFSVMEAIMVYEKCIEEEEALRTKDKYGRGLPEHGQALVRKDEERLKDKRITDRDQLSRIE
jgi:hypothetical protein